MNDTTKRKISTAIWASVIALTIFAAFIALGLFPPPTETIWEDGYGNTYKGVMKNAELTGDFEITYKDGSAYKGQLKDGRFEGAGTYTSADGRRFNGYFKDGQVKE